MKLVIAGSRSFKDYEFLKETMTAMKDITEVISGGAIGADKLGEKWAKESKIPLRKMAADWDMYGKRAGFIRNNEMGMYCDEAIIFWDGTSKGSKNMIDVMKRFNKPYKVVLFTKKVDE